MAVVVREQSYDVGGRRLNGVLADGSNGRRVPGILVAHEGRGFTQHPRDRARMLAELGYVAYAPDYFGAATTSLEHAFSLMQPFANDHALFTTYGLAALEVLRAHPNVDGSKLGAIGFCWGGYAVLELACTANLSAVVGFHPGLSLGPLSNPKRISGSVLVCVGDQDPHVPTPARDAFIAEMHAAKVDCQVLLLVGAPHSFTNPEPYHYPLDTTGIGYDPVADRRAWAAMCALFGETLPVA